VFVMADGGETVTFVATGVSPVRSTLVDAPFIREFPLVLECSVIHRSEIGSHVQFIGKILDVKADEDVLGADKRPLLARINPLGFDWAEKEYHAMGAVSGKAFAAGKRFLR